MPTGIYNHKTTKTPIYTKDRNKKIGIARRGIIFTEEHKKKLKGKRPNVSEEKSHRWLGDKVGYCGIHNWVNKWRGKPTQCEWCRKKKTTIKSIQWANIDHKYRRVLEDYISICVSCHRKYDIKYNNCQSICQHLKSKSPISPI